MRLNGMGDETVSLYWQSTGISQRFMNDLLAYCFSNPVIQKVVFFGSRARGDYRKTSDIDLSIYINNATHSQQNLIEYQIQEMPTLLKIDILFMDRVSKEKLIANIEKDGIVVYERGKTLRKAK
ncbi:nucleotidyltransferase domain-containing protein [Bacillus smithii]|uniref:nucleotidyltransferase domain-containing protein n=1 Tax=Bacillus smithii TaxID=1479 RepID=UPI0030C9578A